MKRKLTDTQILAPRSGASIVLKQSQSLEIIDIEGGQVVDLVAFSFQNRDEWLSSGRSIDYSGKIYLTTGDTLYSNESTEMLHIKSDTAGRHDFIFTPCSQRMFEIQYDITEPNPNCLDNLAQSLQEFGITLSQIPTPFNIFMNIEFAKDGTYQILPPSSRAGDAIEFVAQMDLIVGLSTCSAGAVNNHTFSSVTINIYSPE